MLWSRSLTYFCCLAGLAVLFFVTQEYAQSKEVVDWKVELKQIDEEIETATNLRNRYLAAASRAEDEGQRWQFQQNQKQEAKRAYQRAEEKRQAAKLMDERIAELNARRAQILKEHPEANAVERPS